MRAPSTNTGFLLEATAAPVDEEVVVADRARRQLPAVAAANRATRVVVDMPG